MTETATEGDATEVPGETELAEAVEHLRETRGRLSAEVERGVRLLPIRRSPASRGEALARIGWTLDRLAVVDRRLLDLGAAPDSGVDVEDVRAWLRHVGRHEVHG